MKSTRLIATFLIVIAAWVPAHGDDLLLLSGKSLNGEFVGIEGEEVLFKDMATNSVARVPLQQLQWIDLKNPAVSLGDNVKRDLVELIDGSKFVVSEVLIKNKTVELTPLDGPEGIDKPKLTVPLGDLFTILRGAESPQNRVEWRALMASRGKRDLFVIRSSTGLQPLPGTVLEGNETGQAVTFEREDGVKANLKLSRASGGLVFNQPPRGEIPSTLCKVTDAFGNLLTAQALTITDSGLTVKTVSGAEINYPNIKAIAKLDFTEGNLAYLSDLEPEVDAPQPELGDLGFTFLRDRTPEGDGLKLNGQKFNKGLWLFPDVTLTYDLDGEYREFQAVLGIDERVPVGNSSARIVIQADGRTVYTGTVNRKDEPTPLTLDVNGVKTLRIITGAESLFLGGQLNLADARVQK